MRIDALPEGVRKLVIVNCVKFNARELVFLVFAFRILWRLALLVVLGLL